MDEFRDMCKSTGIDCHGIRLKDDIFHLVCRHLGISTSGDSNDAPSVEKSSVAAAMLEEYGKLPSFFSYHVGLVCGGHV